MRLGVNVDHVAVLRQARGGLSPDPIAAARVCEQGGCDSIVCHLREDRRHIQDQDLKTLRKTVQTKLNLEMSCAEEIVKIALEVKPDQATLVPERRQELTTEGGLDVVKNLATVRRVVQQLSASGIAVSLFIDPEETQIKAAREVAAKAIELHTGRYAEAGSAAQVAQELTSLKQSAKLADQLGLQAFAGHGLNYQNVQSIVKIKQVVELNIGQAIIAHSVFVGLAQAVAQMLALIKTGKA